MGTIRGCTIAVCTFHGCIFLAFPDGAGYFRCKDPEIISRKRTCMEIKDLQYFIAIGEAGSFTAAAERLYISQQGLSSAVPGLDPGAGAVHPGCCRIVSSG